ncbi:hypothetical protein [Halothiobacillus sp. DCM-1]|uniref:hypothetical protein n=1 Tax=Halothiobacillus sp. DCM-1 TaxID=3112558 RepID=UPI003249BC69
MPTIEAEPQPCWRALWRRNRGAALFMIVPALGLWLVAAIFTPPPPLWLGAAGMTALMAGLLGHLIWRDFTRYCRHRANGAARND